MSKKAKKEKKRAKADVATSDFEFVILFLKKIKKMKSGVFDGILWLRSNDFITHGVALSCPPLFFLALYWIIRSLPYSHLSSHVNKPSTRSLLG